MISQGGLDARGDVAEVTAWFPTLEANTLLARPELLLLSRQVSFVCPERLPPHCTALASPSLFFGPPQSDGLSPKSQLARKLSGSSLFDEAVVHLDGGNEFLQHPWENVCSSIPLLHEKAC